MPTRLTTAVGKGKNGFEVGKNTAIKAIEKTLGAPIELVIVFSSGANDHEAVLAGITSVTGGAKLIGCSSAAEFTDKEVMHDAVCLGVISSDNAKFFLSMAQGLAADPYSTVERAVSELPKKVEGYPFLSAIIFHDALTGKGEETVLSAAAAFGTDIKFVGGSAADLNMRVTPVFVNGRAVTDAVGICLMATKHPILTGVKHGHTPLSPRLKITKAVDNRLYQIDGRPAWEVWAEQTAEAARKIGLDVHAITEATDVVQITARFELGFETNEGEFKVRAPLSKNDDGSINFACAIPDGASFRIMQSEKSAQIASAREAAAMAWKQRGENPLAGALVFECACRGIILGEDFSKGIDGIKAEQGNLPLLGLETFGEICMDPGQFSGYHNTTTVVMLLPE